MDKEKQINRLKKLIFTLDSLGKVDDFDMFIEEHELDLQEIIWGCSYYLEEHLKLLEKGNLI